MKSMINSVIKGAFEDFKVSLQTQGNLCCLKDFRFNEMIIPDYSDKFIQEAYLLKYFPAYLVEYYDIYQTLLKSPNLNSPLRILSIGCGCGLDYYGLELALRQKGTSCANSVYYTGIDNIDWIYKNNFENDDFYFLQRNILELKDVSEINGNDFNIIIFPKSIGEFEDNEFDKLKSIFKSSNFSKDHLFLISSVRKQHSSIDTRRMASILELLEKHHKYSCDKSKTQYTYYKRNVGLRTYFYDFVYPQNVLEYLKKLNIKCPYFIKNGKYCEDDCNKNLSNKSPILTTDHIIYQIFDLSL